MSDKINTNDIILASQNEAQRKLTEERKLTRQTEKILQEIRREGEKTRALIRELFGAKEDPEAQSPKIVKGLTFKGHK